MTTITDIAAAIRRHSPGALGKVVVWSDHLAVPIRLGGHGPPLGKSHLRGAVLLPAATYEDGDVLWCLSNILDESRKNYDPSTMLLEGTEWMLALPDAIAEYVLIAAMVMDGHLLNIRSNAGFCAINEYGLQAIFFYSEHGGLLGACYAAWRWAKGVGDAA